MCRILVDVEKHKNEYVSVKGYLVRTEHFHFVEKICV
jgi:hypothetical protein